MRWFVKLLVNLWEAFLFCVGLITVVGFGYWISIPDDRTEEQKAIDRNCDANNAFFASHQFIEAQLKAPSTAKFSGTRHYGSGAKRISQCSFWVFGFVDAQNSFGATIRSRWSLTATFNPAAEYWSASDISIN